MVSSWSDPSARSICCPSLPLPACGMPSARLGAGTIKRHRQTMVALFWMALILTGFLSFWPGRVMYQVVTGA